MAVNKTDKHHFRLSLIQVDKTGEKILSEKTLSANTENIKLKVSSFGTHYDFYYTTGSSAWNLLANKVDAYVLSTDAAGGFTGTTIGMYAVRME
jgi:alpha-N-arabinofuranosidase